LTFVELLMAATLFSILMVGLSAHLRGGILAWRRAQVMVDELQRVRVALERLTQDLANAVLVDSRADATPKTLFAADALQFLTTQPPPGLSAVPSGTGQAGAHQAASRIWVVTYRLDDGIQPSALLRSAQTVRAARASLEARTDTLLANVKRLAIRYGYLSNTAAPGVEWRATWDDPAQLPKLLELTIELERPSALPRQIRRVVVIPQGILKSVEETG
jgi:type II secretion system protein J